MDIVKVLLYLFPPRYYIRRWVRRFFRFLWRELPDILLIAGCTVVFLALWNWFFIK